MDSHKSLHKSDSKQEHEHLNTLLQGLSKVSEQMMCQIIIAFHFKKTFHFHPRSMRILSEFDANITSLSNMRLPKRNCLHCFIMRLCYISNKTRDFLGAQINHMHSYDLNQSHYVQTCTFKKLTCNRQTLSTSAVCALAGVCDV